MKLASENISFIEWAAASKTHPHEVICGDAYVVTQTRNGVLLCVIDGLGHGPEAAEASRTAADAILNHDDASAEELIAKCHDVLKTTRGAVLSLAVLDESRHIITWVGIGNVEGILLRPDGHREWLPLRTGIVGCRMPGIRATEMTFSPDDLLVMFSDGITSRLLDHTYLDRRPAEMAEKIISTQAKGNDDALVLVARYQSSGELTG